MLQQKDNPERRHLTAMRRTQHRSDKRFGMDNPDKGHNQMVHRGQKNQQRSSIQAYSSTTVWHSAKCKEIWCSWRTRYSNVETWTIHERESKRELTLSNTTGGRSDMPFQRTCGMASCSRHDGPTADRWKKKDEILQTKTTFQIMPSSVLTSVKGGYALLAYK